MVSLEGCRSYVALKSKTKLALALKLDHSQISVAMQNLARKNSLDRQVLIIEKTSLKLRKIAR